MKRNWVFDGPVKRALAFARKRKLDLGADIVRVDLSHVESEPSVQPDDQMVEAIRAAVESGNEWPADMPLPVLACAPMDCVTLDGNHRVKAARRLGLREIPAVVTSLRTWRTLLPILERRDVIPYDDFMAVLAEAGCEEVRMNLRLESAAREKYGSA